MFTMESAPKKKCGRPRDVTDSERKKKKAELDKARGKSRISIGAMIDRWQEVKSENSLASHEEVAKFLLDRSSYLLDQAQTVNHTESHQHIQTSPQMKNQVHDFNQKEKFQHVQKPKKMDFPGLLAQNAVPCQPGATKHQVFLTQTGGKPLLVLPDIKHTSVATARCVTPLNITGRGLPSTKDCKSTSLTSPFASNLTVSTGSSLPAVSTNYVLQHSNFGQAMQSDSDTSQIMCEIIKQEPVSEEEIANNIGASKQLNQNDENQEISISHGNQQILKQEVDNNHANQQDVNQIFNSNIGNKQDEKQILDGNHGKKQDMIQIHRSDNDTGEEGDDIVLNMYCSTDDDADDESDESSENTTTPIISWDSHVKVNQTKRKSLTTETKLATRKRGTYFSHDADGAVMSPSLPKKVHLESDDTVNSYRSERLRKRRKISFVELLKGNVVFKKNRKGEIYAKERESFSESDSSGKT